MRFSVHALGLYLFFVYILGARASSEPESPPDTISMFLLPMNPSSLCWTSLGFRQQEAKHRVIGAALRCHSAVLLAASSWSALFGRFKPLRPVPAPMSLDNGMDPSESA
ncbi:MAG: hypothetical protein J3Q66DRAFT_376026 [Benniella sp.]|nr:MAG: hypothetical protein J3Q66DRAFT_376026 [Benniella sp.]